MIPQKWKFKDVHVRHFLIEEPSSSLKLMELDLLTVQTGPYPSVEVFSAESVEPLFFCHVSFFRSQTALEHFTDFPSTFSGRGAQSRFFQDGETLHRHGNNPLYSVDVRCASGSGSPCAPVFVQCHKELGNISEATNWAELALNTASSCDEAPTNVRPAPSNTGYRAAYPKDHAFPIFRLQRRGNWRLSCAS